MSWRSLQKKSKKDPDLWPRHWALGSRLLHPFHLNVRNGLKFRFICGKHMYQCWFLDYYFFHFFRKNELSVSKCRRGDGRWTRVAKYAALFSDITYLRQSALHFCFLPTRLRLWPRTSRSLRPAPSCSGWPSGRRVTRLEVWPYATWGWRGRQVQSPNAISLC